MGVWRGGENMWSVCGHCTQVVYLFPIEVDVSTERSSGTREGEHRQRDRNRNIDTNLCASVWVCVGVVCGVWWEMCVCVGGEES